LKKVNDTVIVKFTTSVGRVIEKYLAKKQESRVVVKR
jgi:hypothetical protein